MGPFGAPTGGPELSRAAMTISRQILADPIACMFAVKSNQTNLVIRSPSVSDQISEA
jgi:hypothetical protein